MLHGEFSIWHWVKLVFLQKIVLIDKTSIYFIEYYFQFVFLLMSVTNTQKEY